MLVGKGDALVGVYFDNAALAASPPPAWTRDDLRLRLNAQQPTEHCRGTRTTTFDVAACGAARPEFRKAACGPMLLRHPVRRDERTTYGELAGGLCKTGGSKRAVAAAPIYHNPIAIIIPRHRVISADGSLTGYGGLMSCKRVLLDLEARVAPPRFTRRCARRGLQGQLVFT